MEGAKLSEPQRQSKFSEIDQALENAERACNSLENMLDTLQGSPQPVPEKAGQSDKPFVEVYGNISTRTHAVADRIRSAIGRIQEMLI